MQKYFETAFVASDQVSINFCFPSQLHGRSKIKLIAKRLPCIMFDPKASLVSCQRQQVICLFVFLSFCFLSLWIYVFFGSSIAACHVSLNLPLFGALGFLSFSWKCLKLCSLVNYQRSTKTGHVSVFLYVCLFLICLFVCLYYS